MHTPIDSVLGLFLIHPWKHPPGYIPFILPVNQYKWTLLIDDASIEPPQITKIIRHKICFLYQIRYNKIS